MNNKGIAEDYARRWLMIIIRRCLKMKPEDI
jgi:hypothetical protein